MGRGGIEVISLPRFSCGTDMHPSFFCLWSINVASPVTNYILIVYVLRLLCFLGLIVGLGSKLC